MALTRDTLGLAMKATYCEVNGESIEIYKDPKTDDGLKKSARGLLTVQKEGGKFILKDQVQWNDERQGELSLVFVDGHLFDGHTVESIRKTAAKSLK